MTPTSTSTTLPQPTNLIAEAVSESEIILSWDDNSLDETSFHIERSYDGVSNWTVIGSVDANIRIFNDQGLICSTTYYYQVQAYRDGDALFSQYSNIASATTHSCVWYTWENMGIYGGNISDAIIDPSTEYAYLVLGGYPGIYRSEDYGENWVGIGPGYSGASQIMIGSDGAFYANFNGIQKSEDGGENWTTVVDSEAIPLAGTITSFDIDANNVDHIVIGTGSGGSDHGLVYSTQDGGNTWTQSDISLANSVEVVGLAIDPSDLSGNTVYAVCRVWATASTPSHIYRSNDGGLTFSIVFTVPEGEKLYAVSVCETGTTLAGGTSGLYRSENGFDWQNVIDDTEIYFIDFSASPSSTIYTDSHVSYDDGVTWAPFSVNEFFAQSTNNPDIMFTFSGLGIRRTMDGGNTWEDVVHGIEAVLIWSTASDATDDQILYVGSGQG
jgi:hypothetical protein